MSIMDLAPPVPSKLDLRLRMAAALVITLVLFTLSALAEVEAI